MRAAPPLTGPGLFGKLPSTGDFVRERLPLSFVEPWDAWLQEGMVASRADLGACWLDRYLVAPVWHFVLAAGVCGPQPVAGVLLPSVDSVNRHFPLTLAVLLPEAWRPFAALAGLAGWFARAEALALDCLDPAMPLTDLAARLAAIAPEFGDAGPPDAVPPDAAAPDLIAPAASAAASAGASPGASAGGSAGGSAGASPRASPWAWRLPAAGRPWQAPALYALLLDHLAAEALASPYGLWLTQGGDGPAAAFRVEPHLPAAAAFAGLLGGGKADRTGAA